MDELIRRANLALLEGNRDEVLRLLKDQPSTPEVLWLRAHAFVDDAERLQLLQNVAHSGQRPYASLAQAILGREDDFETRLAEPAPYQFWKREGFQNRMAKVREDPVKYILPGVFVLLAIIALIVWGITAGIKHKNEQALVLAQTQTATALSAITPILPTPTPSLPPLPQSKRISVSYESGLLTLYRIEYPTTRPVTYSSYSLDNLAVPATGSEFVAVEFQFTCQLAVCATPPEAEVALELNDGQVIAYQSGSRPMLVEQPAMPRVASGALVTGWFVFEVPKNSDPQTIIIYTRDENNPELEIPWPY